MNGHLDLPTQIIDLVGTDHEKVMNNMFQSLWNNYRKNKSGISAPYWSDRFANPKAFNKFLRLLSKAGWITTIVETKRNWGEIYFNEEKLAKWITPTEVLSMRQYTKFNQYKLGNTSVATPTLTRSNGHTASTGINRPGQTKQSASLFKYDTVMLAKYKEEIILNTTKSMRKLELEYDIFMDDVDYKAISTEIVEHHMYSPDTEFCLGGHVSDSRGRAISAALSKVFNPIGFKDARSLLVIESRPLGLRGHTQVYLAIAELLGYKEESTIRLTKSGKPDKRCKPITRPYTIEVKTEMGQAAYSRRAFHSLDLGTDKDRADLYENIWLERLYDNLDNYDGTNWNVPIELDATASVLQVEGILLNHLPYLEKTNIVGATLEDVWTVEGIPRKMYKAVATPSLYGSSATPQALWTAGKMNFNSDQARKMIKDIDTGVLSVSDKFKEFIIANVKPKASMTIKVWGEEFTINCNRFRNVGDYTKKYDVYCSVTDTVKSIYHTHTHREADLNQFRRYFVTALVHNIDSQIADVIANSIDWCIPIYDAFIVHPADAYGVRMTYAQQLDTLYADRDTVLREYFTSIGIDSKSAMEWSALKECIVPATEFKAQLTALK